MGRALAGWGVLRFEDSRMNEVNVCIEHWQKGSRIEVREFHNVWTFFGKEYLSRLVALQVIAPGGDVPQEDARVKYLAFGIGGKGASSAAFGPEFLDAYPPGFDPNATSGNKYDRQNPTGPLISTLERPIRISGTQLPYASASLTDVWLQGPPSLSIYYRDIHSVTFKAVVDCTAGDIVYGTFLSVPLSEIGLVLSSASVHQAFGEVVAYANFDSILLTLDSVVTFSWTVRFAS